MKNLYDSACSEITSGNYSIAESLFKQIISDYPQSLEASSSVKSLYSLENLTDSNYADLKSYYQTEPNLQSDSVLFKLSTWLTAHCDTRLKNYQDAISFFESIILNPDTVTDSTFAIIDLGYVYLKMQNDSSNANLESGKMPQYIPKSYQQYNRYRQYLIDLLCTGESAYGIDDPDPVQETNNIVSSFRMVPNPVINNAEIEFSLKENSKIKICITNITGSNKTVLVNQIMTKGNHSLEFNNGSFANGLYFISIYVNDLLVKTKKLIIHK